MKSTAQINASIKQEQEQKEALLEAETNRMNAEANSGQSAAA